MLWAFAGVLALQTAALVVIVWRVLRDDAVRREQEHAMLLGVLDRMKATTLQEVAEADAIREANRADVERQTIQDLERSTDLAGEHRAGFYGEEAEGRAAMRAAGLDPDNPAAVLAWNRRLESVV